MIQGLKVTLDDPDQRFAEADQSHGVTVVTLCVFSFNSLIIPSFSHSAQGVIGFTGEKVRANSLVLFFCPAELS